MTRPIVILFEVAPEALDVIVLSTNEGRARRRLVVGMAAGGPAPAVERVLLDRAGAEVWAVVPASEGGPTVAYVLERALLEHTNCGSTIKLGDLDRGRS